MKLMKRTQIYKSTNVTFDPAKCEAFSYRWWKFVARIDGVVFFNNHYYSPTTAKHQSKVRQLLRELSINIDIEAPFPQGIGNIFLDTAIVDAEENLCNEFLAQELKKQERNERARVKRAERKARKEAEFKANLDSVTPEMIDAHRASKLTLIQGGQ